MRNFLLALACLLMLLVTGVTSAQPDDVSRTDMLENIATGIIIPLHETLVEQMAALNRIAGALRDQPALDTLLAAQSQWRQTMTTWRQASLFTLGRGVLALQSAIESSAPPNIRLMEDLIADPAVTLDRAFLETQGSNIAGMRALEYLLFGTVPPEDMAALLASPDGTRRLEYIAALTELLTASSAALLNYWLPEGEDYLATSFPEADTPEAVNEAVAMLILALAEGVEVALEEDLEIPLGLEGGIPDAALVRTPYSEETLSLLRGTLDQVRVVFTGVDEPDALGLNALLDWAAAQHQDAPMSEVIVSVIDQAIVDIDALDMMDVPFAGLITDQAPALEQIIDDLDQLYRLMRTEMVNQLGLSFAFLGGDGD